MKKLTHITRVRRTARFLFRPISAALGLVLAASVGQAQAPRQPNIILIVSDDHGREAIGAYGNRVIRTPNIDALARDSVRFDQAYAATSSCSPSRASILTGRMSHNTGMYGLQHDPNHFAVYDRVQSLPALLAAGGYRTASIGKWHIAPDSVFPFQEILFRAGINPLDSLGRNPVKMADMSAGFIGKSDAPFFLYFAPEDPHRAYPFEIGGKPNSFGNKPGGFSGVRTTSYKPSDVIVPPFLPDVPAVREELAQYYQSVSRVDDGIGRLIAALKAAGKYENTLILYLSDNGAAFPTAKTTLYDPGIHVPLIVHAPGSASRGLASSAMVSLTDIAPTILDYAGVAGPKEPMDGRSFRPVIDRPATAGWDEIYATHTFHEILQYYPMRMVRTRQYKLIYNIAWPLEYPDTLDLHYSSTWLSFLASGSEMFGPRPIKQFLHRPKFELYDLDRDPLEVKNLAEDPRYENVREDLIGKLRAFQERSNDPWIRKWTFE